MNKWKKVIVSPETSIFEAICLIDSGSLQIALVVGKDQHLVGTFTDGDIRRGILRNVSMENPVSDLMNRKPITAPLGMDHASMMKIMKQYSVHQLPILDKSGRLVDLKILDTLLSPVSRDNIVVLMAGGLGTRLRPLTEECPKPMLLIGGKPLLETILLHFIEYGFRRFYISVNYKAEVIEEYFKDGSKWGIEIQYLREKKKMGTAGSLSMLPDIAHEPVIVMNSDLLTKVNFNQFLEFHLSHQSKATMAIRKYEFQVPYGAVTLNNYHIRSIDEKPVQQFFVNAGMYILDPDVVRNISDSYCDMTDLFQDVAKKGLQAVAFPIREYWLDIGKIDEYKKGIVDYDMVDEFTINNNWEGKS